VAHDLHKNGREEGRGELPPPSSDRRCSSTLLITGGVGGSGGGGGTAAAGGVTSGNAGRGGKQLNRCGRISATTLFSSYVKS